jgi:glycogen debranching enzyme
LRLAAWSHLGNPGYTAAERTESNFPVQYIGANVPQAWAAGSVFMLTQALLGFQPDAPRNKLYVDPALPYWLPDLTVRDLHIGKHKLDIRFWTEGDATVFEVKAAQLLGILH